MLIRVHAFGLNRSELYTRQGHSPGVEFPRVLGIEGGGGVASLLGEGGGRIRQRPRAPASDGEEGRLPAERGRGDGRGGGDRCRDDRGP